LNGIIPISHVFLPGQSERPFETYRYRNTIKAVGLAERGIERLGSSELAEPPEKG
jgi:hypothetical protein